MKKTFKVIGIIVIIIGILFALAWIWVSGLKEDRRITRETVQKIVEKYDGFNTKIEEFVGARTEFYEFKEDLYLDTLSEEAEKCNETVKKYEESIVEVENASKFLKKVCKIKYGDVNANSKCTAFRANYEAANNYYISDIKTYNELIDDYNKTDDSKNGPEVNKGKYPVYKKYIDFDDDGEYFGKEEVTKDEQ